MGRDPADLSDDTDILGSGLVDSLGFVDLLMSVESELGQPLALERLDFDQIDCLGALVDQLHGLLSTVETPTLPEAGSPTGS
jgi:acyl carrier protein